ncbi:leucine-rich repeat-domain-containing protein [Gorgonomyces haynaldii]|nr:leucine-rich repeat-domain-containing protein [Gorgonomyces haynaldii]
MSKLDFDLLTKAPVTINCVASRQLDLRGHKLARIENLSLTKDQNDTIDFTDNDLRILDNFPLLTRLHTLLLSNNRISRIDQNIGKWIPHLENLVLNNNQLTELSDLEPLFQLTHLKFLSLLDNTVIHLEHYRLFLIHKIPSIRILDFQRVTEKERTDAQHLFSGPKGAELLVKLVAKKSQIQLSDGPKKNPTPAQPLTKQEIQKIKEAIKNAKTLEEIAFLEKSLSGGAVPQ